MKRILAVLLTLAMTMASGVWVCADTLDGYRGLDRYRGLGSDDSSPLEKLGELLKDAGETVGDIVGDTAGNVIDGILDRISGKEKETEAFPEPPETEPNNTAPAIITSGDYQYWINEDQQTVTIAAYEGNDSKIEIPSEIDGYQVSDIGPGAFRYRKMKSLSVPDTVRTIGEAAFEYGEITDSLQLPENCTISKYAFSYADLPIVVIIPAGTTAEYNAFSYCELVEKVSIDPNAEIKSQAFSYCDDLREIVCADGSRLETEAFGYCRGLESVTLCGEPEMQEDPFYLSKELEITVVGADSYDTLRQSVPVPPPVEDWEMSLEILENPVSMNGVTVVLEAASAEKTDTLGFEYTFSGRIENNTDEGIMQVVYTFALIDEAGEEYRSFGEVYDGEDEAIPPHSTVRFYHDGIKWGPQSIPATVKIGISSVKTETELPPVNVPKTGEFLYQALGDEKLENIKNEPPAELSFHIDEGGYGRTATFTEGAELDKAVQLLCAIQIGEESGEWVTDNYNWIGLTWQDGSYTGISLNLYNLEYYAHSNIHTYELENLGAFWSYCAEYLVED